MRCDCLPPRILIDGRQSINTPIHEIRTCRASQEGEIEGPIVDIKVSTSMPATRLSIPGKSFRKASKLSELSSPSPRTSRIAAQFSLTRSGGLGTSLDVSSVCRTFATNGGIVPISDVILNTTERFWVSFARDAKCSTEPVTRSGFCRSSLRYSYPAPELST